MNFSDQGTLTPPQAKQSWNWSPLVAGAVSQPLPCLVVPELKPWRDWNVPAHIVLATSKHTKEHKNEQPQCVPPTLHQGLWRGQLTTDGKLMYIYSFSL